MLGIAEAKVVAEALEGGAFNARLDEEATIGPRVVADCRVETPRDICGLVSSMIGRISWRLVALRATLHKTFVEVQLWFEPREGDEPNGNLLAAKQPLEDPDPQGAALQLPMADDVATRFVIGAIDSDEFFGLAALFEGSARGRIVAIAVQRMYDLAVASGQWPSRWQLEALDRVSRLAGFDGEDFVDRMLYADGSLQGSGE